MVRSTRSHWRRSRQRRFSRPVGCLFWVLALVVFLLLLSLLFGGFQRGQKVGSARGQRLQPSAQEFTLSGIARLGDR
jgi:hypothetical protein